MLKRIDLHFIEPINCALPANSWFLKKEIKAVPCINILLHYFRNRNFFCPVQKSFCALSEIPEI